VSAAARKQSPGAGLAAAAKGVASEQKARETADALLNAAYLEGWSFRDIADETGLSHGTIRNRIIAFRKRQGQEGSK